MDGTIGNDIFNRKALERCSERSGIAGSICRSCRAGEKGGRNKKWEEKREMAGNK